MKVVIQRVRQAEVIANGNPTGRIDQGLLVFAGFEAEDTEEDLSWTAGKVVQLRIFDDENQVPNRSVTEIGGSILLVSQFTLHASTKKGNRPSYLKAARPEVAIPLYERFIQLIESGLGKPIATGLFGADMQVSLINDGPLTILIDSKNKE